jgi:zinc transporter, ZIP family
MTQAVESRPAPPPVTEGDGSRPRGGAWSTAATVAAIVLPLAALTILLVVLVAADPLRSITSAPPTEAMAVERVTFSPGSVELRVRNDGPEPVTVAQVLVNDAYWDHSMSDRSLDRFQAATIEIAYPWQEGLPLNIAMVSSTGLTFEHEVEVATVTPVLDGTVLRRYALVGLLVGVLPIAVGLLWLPALRRAPPAAVAVVLAFTVGLLAILLVETVVEGLELARDAPGSLGGVEVFAGCAIAVLVVMAAIDHVVVRRRSSGAAGFGLGVATAYLVAVGIGLHNLGEGVAIGAAVAAGELALGSALLVGFAAHNATEGVAIASPLAGAGADSGADADGRGTLPWGHLAVLVVVAGAPTILGAWLGALAFSPLWAAAMFGIAAGAIAQVIVTIGRSLLRRPLSLPVAAGFVAGLAVMYVTGLLAF